LSEAAKKAVNLHGFLIELLEFQELASVVFKNLGAQKLIEKSNFLFQEQDIDVTQAYM